MKTIPFKGIKTVKVSVRGYYDTLTEHVALLEEGAVLPVLDNQPEAPCRSKIGKGVWAIGTCLNSKREVTVFVDKT